MNKHNLDDDAIVVLYCNKNLSLKNIGELYNVSKTTIRRHLKWKNIQLRPTGIRNCALPWSPEEDELLIEARESGLTGSELAGIITTRTYAAIRARMYKLRLERKLR